MGLTRFIVFLMLFLLGYGPFAFALGAPYGPSRLLVVDAGVENATFLIEDIQSAHPQFEWQVVFIQAQQEGLERVTKALAQSPNITAVDIISHGQPGGFNLGVNHISLETLAAYSQTFEQWGSLLPPKTALFIYGCHLAQSFQGQQLLWVLNRLTGANIAASTNVTGTADGADWALEFQTGPLISQPLFTQALPSHWQGQLPNTAPTVANLLVNQVATRSTPSTAFSYTFASNTFYDADGNTLTYTATKQDGTALPSWLSFSSSTRTFSGTPSSIDDVAATTIRVTANDGQGGTVYDDFVLQVRNRIQAETYNNMSGVGTGGCTDSSGCGTYVGWFDVNDWFVFYWGSGNPVQPSSGVYTIDFRVATNTSGRFYYSDADNRYTNIILDVSVASTGGWDSWATYTYKLYITGYWNYGFTGVSGNTNFNWFQVTPNDSPTVSRALANQTASVSSAFNYQFAAQNEVGNIFEDTDTLTYTAAQSSGAALPSGITFNSSTRTLSGTPTSAGTYTIRVTASDGFATAYSDFTLTITGVHHFSIDVGSGIGSNCAASSITITAQDSSNATSTNYTGSISITTSTNHGDWAKTGTASDAYGTLTAGSSNSGAASYTFTTSDAGSIVLNLTNAHAEALTISVNDATAGVTSTSSTLTFSQNGFVITSTDSLANDIVAGRSHSFRATLQRRSTAGVACSTATGYNIANVKMWISRSAADPNGTAPSVLTSSNVSVSLPSSKPGSNNVLLGFSSGVADFTLNTTDVGRYTLNIADSSNTFASSEITGASSSLTARPFAFLISATANPGATSASGSVYTTAGTNFSVSVTAKAWQSTDDLNNDGIADNYNDATPNTAFNLSDNSTLAAFGQETPAQTITLTAQLGLPAGGVDPGLGDGDATATDGRVISSFTNGVGTTSSVYYAEVGIIQLITTVTGGDYLSAGTTATTNSLTKSAYVGRFKPSKFSLSAGAITPFCSSVSAFTYLGQPFTTGFTLTAQNALGATTANYTGSFAKLSSTGYQFKALDTTANTQLTSRLTNASVGLTWGAGTASPSGQLTLDRSASPDGPYTSTKIGLSATDTDSVTFASGDLNLDADQNGSNESIQLGQTAFRHGRLNLQTAHGPETAALPVNFNTEYFSAGEWYKNTLDSCTTLATSQISYPNGAISTSANRTVTLGAGSTTGSYTSLAGSAVNFTQGDAGHQFSSPGAGNTGTLTETVSLANYAWLRFDWNNDGSHTDTSLPQAKFTFGSYRGHDKQIFWQENLP